MAWISRKELSEILRRAEDLGVDWVNVNGPSFPETGSTLVLFCEIPTDEEMRELGLYKDAFLHAKVLQSFSLPKDNLDFVRKKLESQSKKRR